MGYLNYLYENPCSETVEALKKALEDNKGLLRIQVAAVESLLRVNNESSWSVLITHLESGDEYIIERILKTLDKNQWFDSLSTRLTARFREIVKDKVQWLEDRKQQWRSMRDENTENYNEDQMKTWRQRLEEVLPKEYLEYECAYFLARHYAEEEGLRLLCHPLVNVRRGAWAGIAANNDAGMLDKLYPILKEDNRPWCRTAAYRAIDELLVNIEAIGGEKEIQQLEKFQQNLQNKEGKDIHPAVATRLQWTIDRLKERIAYFRKIAAEDSSATD